MHGYVSFSKIYWLIIRYVFYVQMKIISRNGWDISQAEAIYAVVFLKLLINIILMLDTFFWKFFGDFRRFPCDKLVNYPNYFCMPFFSPVVSSFSG
ncbi:hypothetical protein BI364_15700 [Acidihalobacter yilgarnensis]|uniref:Uncharacterized protein n=1 Tax=Acidihalobacter yilgarnensis TaxID=2819280 RepID=A0A1D8IS19_9GAMM|nr:hypothetical protein BI364_15700 [Acidihalobacter yilgarnensis]